jgi:hypothetical protein
MDKLRRHVRGARRRLVMEQFLGALSWCLLATLGAAAVAIAAPKFIYLNVDPSTWMWGWLGGAACVALLAAGVWTLFCRRTELDAAIEIDRRFALKERIASSWSLSEADRESLAGQAVIRDAARFADKIDVPTRFPIRLSRHSWAPLAPAAVALCVALILTDKQPDSKALAVTTAEITAVKTATESLSKDMARLKKVAQEQGLEDVAELLKEVEEGSEKLAKDPLERKDGLVKLNDLSEQLQQRREALGGDEQLKEQLRQMKNLSEGPADQLASAMKQGDFKKAMEQLDKLRKEIASGNLDEQTKEQLAQQLQQLQEQLEQIAQARKEAMERLEQQIAQQKAAGNRDAAAQLQRQLDKMQSQNQQMQKIQQIAQQMGECSQCIGDGDGEGAAQAMAAMAAAMEGLQGQMSELAMLQDALDQIAMAKDAMACGVCNGQGCAECQGAGGQKGLSGGGDGGKEAGMGQGRSFADDPSLLENGSTFDSNVRQRQGIGRVIVTGMVDGPNSTEEVLDQIQAELISAERVEEDPLTAVEMPRDYREHAKEYMENIREGN